MARGRRAGHRVPIETISPPVPPEDERAMSRRPDPHSRLIEDPAAPGGLRTRDPSPAPIDPGPYQPSRAFRRALGRVVGERDGSRAAEGGPNTQAPAGATACVPGLVPRVGGALVVGVAAGSLELATLFTQVHGLHRVGPGTFR